MELPRHHFRVYMGLCSPEFAWSGAWKADGDVEKGRIDDLGTLGAGNDPTVGTPSVGWSAEVDRVV